jgi:hypothetical protein
MLDIEKELRALSQNKEYPSDALRERTRTLVRQECQCAQEDTRPAAHERRVAPARRTMRWVAVFTAAVAVMLAAVLVLAPPQPAQAAGYYTVDINPSVSLSVDSSDIILSATAGNDDAKALLDGLSLVGLSIEDALSAIVHTASENGWLKENGHVLVAHFGDTPGFSTQQASDIVDEAAGGDVSVLVLKSTRNDYENAEKDNKNAGIELLKKNAKDLGINTDSDTDTIIREVRGRQNEPEPSPASTESPEESPAATPGNNGNGNGGNTNQGGSTAHKPDRTGSQDDKGNNGKPDNQQGNTEPTPHPGNGKSEETHKSETSKAPDNPKDHKKQN